MKDEQGMGKRLCLSEVGHALLWELLLNAVEFIADAHEDVSLPYA